VTQSANDIPDVIQTAYGIRGAARRRIPSLINQTFAVEGSERAADSLVLQRLHPVFGANVNEDIWAVTEHLARRGVVTPRLVPALSGALWVADEGGHPWRALSFVRGLTFHRARSAAQLRSAAELLSAFQAALVDLDHTFVHQRPLHESARHFALLEQALASPEARADGPAQSLGSEILRRAERARTDFSALPRRVCHGDPKLSNVLFHTSDPERALCWIDLDTIGTGYLAYELGDALRSWCNPAGEDADQVEVQLPLFEATFEGYVAGPAPAASEAELLSVIDGLQTVSLELASRFARDVIEDRYFGWDETRFATRREHNLLRARGQLGVALSTERQLHELTAAVQRLSQGAAGNAAPGGRG
jgi:Ser/Thr protein kinase RdoA (MazF antagonist)